MKFWALLGITFTLASLLPACKTNNKNPLPLYLAAESPLDAPGEAAARKEMLHSRAKEGLFPKGASVGVAGGKAFFFATNPELDGGNKGKMMSAKEVKIITCEGLYYYVLTSDGDGGYLRETDLIHPTSESTNMALPASSLGEEAILVQGADFCLPLTGEDGLLPLDASLMAENESLATKADGRVVTVINKKTEASERFKEEAAKLDKAAPIPDLPEPSQNSPSKP